MITIICTTYFPSGPSGEQRRLDAQHTINSWAEHLRYDGDLCLHVADDGTPEQVLLDIPPRISSWTKSVQQRHGVGASLNAGLRVAFERSSLAAYFVDDWALDGPLDLTPWARLLERDESIACIRLGIAHPGLTGTVDHDPESGQYYLRLDRHHFAFGHRPALYHRRMIEAYGWFDEDVNAYECERLYNERFCESPGACGCDRPAYMLFMGAHECPTPRRPDVVLALTHHWRHASGVELADIEPRA